MRDPYVAYCVDEAGAWLISQNDPTIYPEKEQTLNGNRALISQLKAAGALKEIG